MPRSASTLALGLLCVFLLGCGTEDPAGYEYGRWTLTGYVLDGATDRPLADAVISYTNAEGNTKETRSSQDGSFVVGSLPFGAQTFRFGASKIVDGDTISYGTRLLVAGSTTESSSMEGVLPNGTRQVRLYPLDASASGEVALQAAGASTLSPGAGIQLRLRYRDTTFLPPDPSRLLATTDAQGKYRFEGLPADTGFVLFIDRSVGVGRTWNAASMTLPRLASGRELPLPRIVLASDSAAPLADPVLASNMMDSLRQGVVGVASSAVPWYRLATAPDSSRLDIQVRTPSLSVVVQPRVKGDTLFLDHVTPFPSDAYIVVEVAGTGRDGRSFRFVLDGTRRFKTRKAVSAVESNAWASSRSYRSAFGPGDTLWVRFSEPLAVDALRVQWSATSAGKVLYGKGSLANATAWIRGDTLFASPDQRLVLATGDKLGFNVVVTAASGSVSAPTEVVGDVDLRTFAVAWTNTKDAAGLVRNDLGTRDSIVVVANRPVRKVIDLAVVSGTSVPAGLLLANVSLRGTDTLVVKPSLAMAPGIAYGLAFDLEGTDGRTQKGALAVQWQTAYRVKIVNVGNRGTSGYRRFKSLGDSLPIEFSEAIDTSAPFVVRMDDANGNPVRMKTAWTSRTRAVLRNSNPLPLADFGSQAVAGVDGDAARAVSEASFDLTTARGEVVSGLRPMTEPVRIYTEEGLCAVSTSLLPGHASAYEVSSTELPADSLPVADAVRATFNRSLDTAHIRTSPAGMVLALETASGTLVPTTLSFADGGRTIVLTPASPLAAGTGHLLRLKNIPGLGIRDAGMVHRHGGVFTGAASGGFLLKTAFVPR